VIDLSHLIQVPGLTPSSMSPSNTVSMDFGMKGPGSMSEATAGIAQGDPRLEVGPVTNHTHGPGQGSIPATKMQWTHADGSGYGPEELSGGRAAPGPWRQV
jgi:hypothetical protein